MTDDDKSKKFTLRNLRGVLTPRLAGRYRAGQKLGSFYGVPFPEHFEKIAEMARESLPLGESTQLELESRLSHFKTEFRNLAAVLEPEQSNAVARLIVDAAFVMSFGTPESLAVLRSSIGRHASKERGSPLTNAVNAAFNELGAGASAKKIQGHITRRGLNAPTPSLISQCRKKLSTSEG